MTSKRTGRVVIKSPPVDWSAGRKADYFEWAREVMAGCRGVNERLELAFDEAFSMRPANEEGMKEMKLLFTIDDQPMVLTPKQAAALFGKTRLREFAEGRWTSFVFCEPYVEDDGREPTITNIDVTNMDPKDVTDLIKTLAPETFTFPDDVMAAVEDEQLGCR